MNTEEFIDIHFHIGPEIIPREFNVEELVDKEEDSIAGIVLKNHMYATQAMIDSLNIKGVELFGSVALNRFTGGMNPSTVKASAEISEKPLTAYFPTLDAENFLKEKEYEIPPEWTDGKYSRKAQDIEPVKVTNQEGELTKQTIQVIQAIAETDSILATGHISWKEAKKVTNKALEMGVKNIVLTHPIYGPIDMPVKIQKELGSKEGVYIEHLYAMNTIDNIPMEKIAKQVREVGPENILLGSDMGQIGNPSSSEAMEKFTRKLTEQGIQTEEIEKMAIQNPKALLNLENSG